MPYEDLKSEGSGFLVLLKEAQKNNRQVHIFATGTYKGITGRVAEIKNGYVHLQEDDGVEIIKLGDIKRLKVAGILSRKETE